MRHLYSEIYNNEFKFERRHTLEVLLPAIDDRSMRLFGGVCFGEFPSHPELQYFRSHYSELFAVSETQVTPKTFFQSLEFGTLNPRRATLHGLDLSRLPGSEDIIVFYMDATSSLDIIDLWNLRALGRTVLPLPIQWRDELRTEFEDLVSRNFLPNSYNPDHWHGTSLMCSPSLDPEDMLEFAASLNLTDGALRCETTFTGTWDPFGRNQSYGHDILLTAKEVDDAIEVQDDSMEFHTISPTFVANTWGNGGPRWINVLQLKSYSEDPESVGALPENVDDWRAVSGDLGFDEAWVSREGIVLACSYEHWRHSWRMPTSVRVFDAWMSERGYKMTVSSAGRSAREILRKLGRYGLWPLAHLELLNALNSMAHGEIEVEIYSDEVSRRRKVRSPALARKPLIDLLKKVSENDVNRALGILDLLTEKEVVRVGVRVECTHCQQFNWYSVNDLGLELQCQRCLRIFGFPSATPPGEWYYRTVGPFATENFAQGGYTVALALHALSSRLKADVTWVPSIELESPEGKKLEADFAMFWQTRFPNSGSSRLILGECKSLNRFELRDIQRMQDLGSTFPSCVLAFCTLRNQLDAEEKRMIARLVGVGRSRRKIPNPIVVLTGLELLGAGLPNCWEKGAHGPARFRQWGIDEIAAITQGIHL
jgi:hypothetical protein